MEMKNIAFMGRFDFSDEKGPKFGWSASTITARFIGTGISAQLSPLKNSYFTVELDGKVINPSLHVISQASITLASDLEPGIHQLKLIKNTEFNIGTAQFLGFNVTDGELLPPAAEPDRRIEFIGDSISCGFGIDGEGLDVDYDPKYDNAYLTYCSITARNLKADHMIIGCSGHGIMRNYGGDTVNTMPTKYSFVTMGSGLLWDFSKWIPQVVVINLGTNDFSQNYIPDRNTFVEHYRRLVERVYGNYPEAHIICALGPNLCDEALDICREYLKVGVVEYFREKNNRITFLEFEQQKKENGYGILFHPSRKTHEIMGKRLTEEIGRIMGW